MDELEAIVSSNLTALRKRRGWTQAELAEKIHYSDKSVSKWERGEALPDLKVLKTLSELYGVTVDCFLTEGAAEDPAPYMAPASKLRYQIWVTLLAVCILWLAATALFSYSLLNAGEGFWTAFIWAIPASAVVVAVFDRRYFRGKLSFPVASIFLWGVITAIFLQWLDYHMWALFIIGAPAQIGLVLMHQIRRVSRQEIRAETKPPK